MYNNAGNAEGERGVGVKEEGWIDEMVWSAGIAGACIMISTVLLRCSSQAFLAVPYSASLKRMVETGRSPGIAGQECNLST